MNSIHSNFSTSFFRQFDFAGALSAPGKKTAAGNEGRGEGSVVGIVRDKLTLSHEGQLAYAKIISKLEQKAQSVPAAQTQATEVVDSTSTDVDTVDKTEQNTQTTQTQAAESVDSNSESSSVPVLGNEKPASDLEVTNHSPAGAQDEGLPSANTSANTGIKELWTLDENGNKLDKLDASASLLTMDYESASPLQRNLIDQAKWISAIHQWERANDFSFSRTEDSNPLTPEEKKKYNEMLIKMSNDGIQPMHGFRTSLNKIEGTDWMIADGAEALIGHEILHWIEGQATSATADTFWNAYSAVDQRINEYGFAMDMPAAYKDLSYLVTTLVDFNGTTQKAPIYGLDAGTIYAPEINFTDALGLGGMSLDDRKLFLDMAQKVLDNVMPGMDVRQLKFSTGQRTIEDVKNNTFSLTLDVAWLSSAQRNTIEDALNKGGQLRAMKLKADASENKTQGELSMSVLDAQGNALAKDQIRLTAGSKSVTTSVDTIKDLDYSQLYDFITTGVLPKQ
jgi:hypothetical protein